MIEQIPTHLGKIRFGPFEVDLRSGELRKFGIRIKLQSQPFKLFAILLSHAGEIVTREELQQQIWGSETVVNFDHSLGTAVNKVREALGDSAENPRYIETLAKRGYRFIATLEGLDSPETSASPQPVLSPEAVSPPRAEAQTAKQTPSSPPVLHQRISGPAIAVVAALAVVAAFRFWWPSESERPRLLPYTQVTSSDSIFPGEVGVERFPVLLTDGSRLYFSKIENGRVALAYSAISGGGEAHALVTPPE